MKRTDVAEKIIAAKIGHGLKWSDVAATVGLSKNGSSPPASVR